MQKNRERVALDELGEEVENIEALPSTVPSGPDAPSGVAGVGTSVTELQLWVRSQRPPHITPEVWDACLPAYAILEWQHSINADWMRLARHDLDHVHNVTRIHNPLEYPEALRHSILRRRKTHEVCLSTAGMSLTTGHLVLPTSYCLLPTLLFTQTVLPTNSGCHCTDCTRHHPGDSAAA